MIIRFHHHNMTACLSSFPSIACLLLKHWRACFWLNKESILDHFSWMWSKQLKIKAKFTKSERLCKWNRRIRLKRTVQSSLCVCVCGRVHSCLPLFRWGRVVPVWPWQSCLCQWFSVTDSYRCAAARLMWSWPRSFDLATYWSGQMITWTPVKEGVQFNHKDNVMTCKQKAKEI